MTMALIGPVALKGVLPTLVEEYRRASGVAVETEILLNPEVPVRSLGGAHFDLAITNPWYVPDLVASGHAEGSSHAAFGRVPLALAAAGATDDPASSPGAIAALLLDAETIAFTGTGTSGRIFHEMTDRLGVRAQIAGRLKPMGTGEPICAVADGRCGLAVAPLTVVRATSGVRAVAICPPEMGTDIEMSIFLARPSSDSPAARDFLSFLCDPAWDPWLERAGVERFTLPG